KEAKDMRIVIIAITFGIFSSITHAAIHRVPYDYSTISQAVAAAREGDTVWVAPGTYKEKLVLERSINLIGEDSKTCILKGDEGANNSTIVTVSDSVHIAGFTISNGKTGIFIKAGASLKIEDCIITTCS
ncbi:DUF1565 domain-containing protein, partial [bacterium]|nr:DUF1565 domain-containing protein [bacterium]